MEFTIRPMTMPERMYCYTQSQQIMAQTGCIGHLRGDMGSSGEQFFSSWDDHMRNLKTLEFADELDAIINNLRLDQPGSFLSNRRALANYCWDHQEARIRPGDDDYGFRLDTETYSYLLRLNPNRGFYNLYCYCYLRERLDRHLKSAEKGIRFIDSHYNEKFRVTDGDTVRLITAGGNHRDMQVRYIDDYHMETNGEWGNNLYHICEFAERFEERGCQDIFPLRNSLPARCYSILESTGNVIIIQKGKKGYYHLEITDGTREENRAFVNDFNTKLGITKAQEEAMKAGSMFGWAIPAADPKNYDEKGVLLHTKQKDRGDTR